MKDLIGDIAYSRWANLRLLRSCEEMDPGSFRQSVTSSFPSVQQTFTHLLWAEALWLERWQGRSFVAGLNPEDYPTPESLGVSFEDTHKRQLHFLTGLPETAANQVISYVNFKGQTWRYPLREMVRHLAVHSAFHRGQIVTLLRQMNVVPPPTDYLVFVDECAKGTPNRAL